MAEPAGEIRERHNRLADLTPVRTLRHRQTPLGPALMNESQGDFMQQKYAARRRLA